MVNMHATNGRPIEKKSRKNPTIINHNIIYYLCKVNVLCVVVVVKAEREKNSVANNGGFGIILLLFAV